MAETTSSAKRINQAKDAAHTLSSQLHSPFIFSLLQGPPLLTKQAAEQLRKCSKAVLDLARLLQDADAAVAGQLLDAVLRQHAVRSAGTLVAWVQKQPEQLFEFQAVDNDNSAPIEPAIIWWNAVILIRVHL